MAETLKQFEEEQKKTEEIKTPPPEGKQEVKEPVVIIDGKPRPLKNYEAELKRKHEEEIQRIRQEYENKPPAQQSQQPNWYEQVQQMAENEIVTTGKTVPINTILQLANTISQRNLETALKTRTEADKEIRNFKRSVKKEKDFQVLEDDFDSLVDQLKPDQINTPTLEVILNSVRGKRLNEFIEKAKTETKQTTESDTKILGQPVETQTAVKKPESTLSPQQQADLDRMNESSTIQWSGEEYLSALRNKQTRFKNAGAKNIPQTLNDEIIK